jgi:hypothetical protein
MRDRRGGKGKSGSRSRSGERRDGPTPDGPWMNGGCAGPKLNELSFGGKSFPFREGEEWCMKESQNYNGSDLCCRCDSGDGTNTERCWI